MNRRLLILVTAPTVSIGLLLLGVCLFGAWHVNRMQANLGNIFVLNVASMQAAQQMETHVRQLRFHSFLYLIDPVSDLLDEIHKDEKQFEDWLVRAEQNSFTDDEMRSIQLIRDGYLHYQEELEKLRIQVERRGPRRDLRALAEAHPIRHITDPCREYSRLNEEMMNINIAESGRVSRRLGLAMLLLGIGGPLSGLLGGYGIARALSRSLYRLSVRVQDMAQKLEKDVGTVHMTPEADWQRLNRQLDHVVGRVAEVAEDMQKQQTEVLRAQQLAAVGQLAASVAHEIRNPLTSIKMLVEVGIRSQRPKPLTSENLKIIHGEILRLEDTVQSLLDFARPPALQKHACDIRAVMHKAVELTRVRARQQRVELRIEGPESPVWTHVDQSQICTVLVNLIINALDAMPTGGTLTVSLRTDRGFMRLEITDDGEGIPPDMLERLFTPFASSKSTGSGLGLTICKRVVEEHGGAISASNRTPRGACFAFTLPLTQEVDDAVTVGH